MNFPLLGCVTNRGVQSLLPVIQRGGPSVVAMGKEAKMEIHQCSAGTQWTINKKSYPKVNLLCETCGRELQSIYLDDLDSDDLDFFTRILKLHKKYRKDKDGEVGQCDE